ncbi:MAG TPA: DolP-mannose mannosyltransferase [Blastocatellia bacterium]|nr:DolP-mannose mannosyltransferase [Blastocatellia bacterium]
MSIKQVKVARRLKEAMQKDPSIATVEESAERKPYSWPDRRLLFAITIAVASVVYAQYHLWEQPERKDRANWDYFSQVISRGGKPYIDVVNIKSPLSAYIGAGAIVLARPFGIRDLFAIRIACSLMGILIVGFTFLVALDYFGCRRLAFLAAIIMLSFHAFASSNSGGMQPKTPMMLFGLISLWATIKDRPFWAGVFAMLSALAWQPGLLFAGAAGLAFSRYLTSWRDMKAARVVAGASVPLAAMLLHIWLIGAFREFYLWTIHFNFSLYAPRQLQSPSSFFRFLMRMLNKPFGRERIYFALALAGTIITLAREARTFRKDWREALREPPLRHAVVIAPLVYFVFCMINFQGSGDLFPLLPFVGVFAAVSILFFIDLLPAAPSNKAREFPVGYLKPALFGAACLLVFYFNVSSAFSFRVGFPTLKDQDADVSEILAQMGPDDKLFVHGQTEILALSGLNNASRHIFLDRGKDIYLDQVEPGGFAGWLDRLKESRPRVVALSRLGAVERRAALVGWVRRDYEVRKGRVFKYYLRKEAAQ